VKDFMTKSTPAPAKAPVATPEVGARAQAVNIAMQQIEKQFGKGSIMKLGERLKSASEFPTVSTGSLAIDMALGIGGFPKGRIVEVYGPEASWCSRFCRRRTRA
jgi:hypothetical protein